MHDFRLIGFEEVYGLFRFYKLVKDNNCQYNDFETIINKEGTYATELNRAKAIMEDFANKKSLPITKLRPLTQDRDEKYKEYEIKTENLRVYFFILPGRGDIVVLGGKKTKQKKDIKIFRKIKNEYLNFLNSQI